MDELLKLGLMTVFVFAVQQGCICLWSCQSFKKIIVTAKVTYVFCFFGKP